MLKGTLESSEEKTKALNLKLEELEELERSVQKLESDKKIKLSCHIDFIKQEKEYWRGVNNTAESILNIIEKKQGKLKNQLQTGDYNGEK